MSNGRVGSKSVTQLIRAYGDINPAKVVSQSANILKYEKEKMREEEEETRAKYNMGGMFLGQTFETLKDFREAKQGGFEGGFFNFIFNPEEGADAQAKGKKKISDLGDKLDKDPNNINLQAQYSNATSLFPNAQKRRFKKQLDKDLSISQTLGIDIDDWRSMSRKDKRIAKRKYRKDGFTVSERAKNKYFPDGFDKNLSSIALDDESFDIDIDDSGFYKDNLETFDTEISEEPVKIDVDNTLMGGDLISDDKKIDNTIISPPDGTATVDATNVNIDDNIINNKTNKEKVDRVFELLESGESNQENILGPGNQEGINENILQEYDIPSFLGEPNPNKESVNIFDAYPIDSTTVDLNERGNTMDFKYGIDDVKEEGSRDTMDWQWDDVNESGPLITPSDTTTVGDTTNTFRPIDDFNINNIQEGNNRISPISIFQEDGSMPSDTIPLDTIPDFDINNIREGENSIYNRPVGDVINSEDFSVDELTDVFMEGYNQDIADVGGGGSASSEGGGRMEGGDWGGVAASIGSLLGSKDNEDMSNQEKLVSQLPNLIKLFTSFKG